MVLFLIVSDDLTFRSNQVGVKTIDVSLVCLFGLNTLEEELVVENSTFSGFGGDLGECHFVGVAKALRSRSRMLMLLDALSGVFHASGLVLSIQVAWMRWDRVFRSMSIVLRS